MCKWGNLKPCRVIRRNNPSVADGQHWILVDACIANYVQRINDQGIITVGCCCGHGKSQGSVLIATESVPLLVQHGYEYHPYLDRDDVVEHLIHD